MIGAVMSEAGRRLAARRSRNRRMTSATTISRWSRFRPRSRREAAIKAFLKQHMYRHPRVMRVMGEAEEILFDLFARYQTSRAICRPNGSRGTERESEGERARRIGNFIAGMTDRFALIEHQRLFDSTPDLR